MSFTDEIHTQKQSGLQEKPGRSKFSQSILKQYEKIQRLDKFFKLFGKAEKPFGNPKETFQMFKLVPKSKTFKLRNTPYKDLLDKMQASIKE